MAPPYAPIFLGDPEEDFLVIVTFRLFCGGDI